MTGSILEHYSFDDAVRLSDIAITADSLRLIGIATNHGFKGPIVYNLQTRQIEYRLWVLDELSYIRVSPTTKSGISVLLGYEKWKPPQLFKLEMTKAEAGGEAGTAQLVFRHTYAFKKHAMFTKRSYFVGKDRELVIANEKDGFTYIWDQESGALLHTVQTEVEAFAPSAWNPMAEHPLMFATGCADGAICLWRNLSEERIQQ